MLSETQMALLASETLVSTRTVRRWYTGPRGRSSSESGLIGAAMALGLPLPAHVPVGLIPRMLEILATGNVSGERDLAVALGATLNDTRAAVTVASLRGLISTQWYCRLARSCQLTRAGHQALSASA